MKERALWLTCAIIRVMEQWWGTLYCEYQDNKVNSYISTVDPRPAIGASPLPPKNHV